MLISRIRARTESTPAVVLRTREFGESDKIVTVLSRAHGKFTGIAKGAKRSRRRFSGSLELFSHVTVEYKLRSHAEMVFLERAVLIRPWRQIVSSFESYAAATHFIEIADKMTIDREVGDEMYFLLVAALARLDDRPPSAVTMRLFEIAALAACGYRQDFAHCAACRRPLSAFGRSARMRCSAGGVFCSSCSARDQSGLWVTPDAATWLARLASTVGRGLPSRSMPGDPALAFADDDLLEKELDLRMSSELRAATTVLLGPHLRSRLRAFELLASGLGLS